MGRPDWQESIGQSTTEERTTQITPECRGSLENLGNYRSTHAYEETKSGEEHLEGLQGAVPSVHTGLGTMPVPTSQIGNIHS